jgi:hypothetical protein
LATLSTATGNEVLGNVLISPDLLTPPHKQTSKQTNNQDTKSMTASDIMKSRIHGEAGGRLEIRALHGIVPPLIEAYDKGDMYALSCIERDALSAGSVGKTWQ